MHHLDANHYTTQKKKKLVSGALLWIPLEMAMTRGRVGAVSCQKGTKGSLLANPGA